MASLVALMFNCFLAGMFSDQMDFWYVFNLGLALLNGILVIDQMR